MKYIIHITLLFFYGINMRFAKIILGIFCCIAFCSNGEELWLKYFNHIDQAEKLFWSAVCGAKKEQAVGNPELFRQVHNHLYAARETAVEIERKIPAKTKMRQHIKVSGVTQDLRVFFEGLQKHPVTKWNSVEVPKTNFKEFGIVPYLDEAGNTRYRKMFRSPHLAKVDLNEYREWLVLVLRFHKRTYEMTLPCYEKIIGLKWIAGGGKATNSNRKLSYSEKMSKSKARRIVSVHNRCVKAVEDYLEIMVKLRIVSAMQYQQNMRSVRLNEEQLWDKYFNNINQAEKMFWDAICCADRDERVGEPFLFQLIDNHLYIAKETAVEIERRFPAKYKNKKFAHLSQDLRFFFEILQKKTVTKWNSVTIRDTEIEDAVRVPQNSRGGLEQYKTSIVDFYKLNYTVLPCRCMVRVPLMNNCVPCPRTVYKEHDKVRRKTIEAVGDFLKLMIKLRIVSAEIYQLRQKMQADAPPPPKKMAEKVFAPVKERKLFSNVADRKKDPPSPPVIQIVPDAPEDDDAEEKDEVEEIPYTPVPLDLNKITADEKRGVVFSEDKKTLLKVPQELSGVYTVPDGITAVAACAFENCMELRRIVLPESVTILGVGSFSGCTNLQNVTLSGRIKNISAAAFMDCIRLQKVEIPHGVRVIGINAFSGCASLQNVKFPKSITAVKRGAFANCVNLQEAELPDKVRFIGKRAFAGCGSLKELHISKQIKTLGENAFHGVRRVTSDSKLFVIDRRGVLIDTARKKILYAPTDISGHYIVPGNIRSIDVGVFTACEELQSVGLPHSVTVPDKTFFHRTLVIKI